MHKLIVKCLIEVTEFRIDIKVLALLLGTVEPPTEAPSNFSHKIIFRLDVAFWCNY